MLEFVTPSLLWLSSLLALPVILHFLHRLRNREIEFSSLTFLRQLQKRKLSRISRFQYLLLLLRLLFMLAVILAFSEPQWYYRGQVDWRSNDLQIVVDKSHSAVPWAQQVQLPDAFYANWQKPGKRIVAIDENGVDTLHFSTPDDFRQWLVSDRHGPGDLRTILATLDRNASGLNERQKWLLLSDGQLHAARDSQRVNGYIASLRARGDVFFLLADTSAAQSGRIIGISDFNLENEPSLAVRTVLQTRNAGQLSLFINTQRQRLLRLPPASSTAREVLLELGQRTYLAADYSLEDANGQVADRYFWGLDLRQPLRVLIVGDSSASAHLASIFRISLRQRGAYVKQVRQTALYAAAGEDWDWLVLVPEYPDAGLVRPIRQLLKTNTRLLLSPGIDETAFIELVAGLHDRRGESIVFSAPSASIGADAGALSPELYDYPRRLQVRRYVRFSDAQGLVNLANGDPLLWSLGNSLVLCAALAADNGNIRLHPGLPLWLMRFIGTQTRSRIRFAELEAARDTLLALPGSFQQQRKLTLSGSSGNYILPSENGRVRIPAPAIARPGHYRLQSDDKELSLAVNIARREQSEVYYEADESSRVRSDDRVGQRLDLWPYLILMAAIFLAMETGLRLFQEKEGKSS
jgi:hypothetical protein